MGNIKQLTLKIEHMNNVNDMINIVDFDSSLPKIDKNSYKSIGIYNIGYITFKTTLMTMKTFTV